MHHGNEQALRQGGQVEAPVEPVSKRGQYQRDLSVLFGRLGDLDGRRDLAQARVWFERALGITQRPAALEPANSRYGLDLAGLYDWLGDLDRMRDPAQARVWFERALAIDERLAEDEPDNRDYQRDLLCSLHKLSEDARMEDLAHVREHCVKAVEISRRLVAIDKSRETMLFHSHWLIQLGMIESELDSSHAVASFDEAIQIRRSFADKDPDDAEAWCLVASAYGNLAEWILSGRTLFENAVCRNRPMRAWNMPSRWDRMMRACNTGWLARWRDWGRPMRQWRGCNRR